VSMPIRSFTGTYRFLSNFDERGAVEWRFQASKTLDEAERAWVLAAVSAGEAKRRGRKVTLREDWEQVKDDIMLALLREKFADEILGDLILSTGTVELIEGNQWGDTYWGVCRGHGRNRLGELLMQVRDELGGRS
jgi:ribA/ribD-fused uncharacterized protein